MSVETGDLLPTFANSTVRHGTLTGANYHVLRKMPLCQPCRAAKNAHNVAYKHKPEVVKVRQSRTRATARLRALYADEVKRLRMEGIAQILADRGKDAPEEPEWQAARRRADAHLRKKYPKKFADLVQEELAISATEEKAE